MKQKSIPAILKALAISLLAKIPRAAFIYVPILTAASFFGGFHRYFELTTHFRLQYFLLSCGFLILFALMRTWRWAGVAVICLAVNVGYIVPWYFPAPSVHTKPGDQKLRLLLSNVLFSNANHAAVIDLMNREKPDLAFFQEVTPRWTTALEGLTTSYPFTRLDPSEDAGGMAVYSRISFAKIELAPLAEYNGPAIISQIQLGNKLVSIVSVHAPPPMPKLNFEHRTAILRQSADYVKTLPEPKIVIGDLNTTMWSPYYKHFVEQTGLINAREGFGLLPTWPAFLPVMKIPIDHCLVSKNVQVANIRTGPRVGSDHLPLIVDLIIPPD